MSEAWPRVALGSVAAVERSSVSPDAIGDGTNYLGLEHISSGGEVGGPQVVQQGDLASQKFQFDSGHILYGKLRPYLGKITVPDFSGVCSTDILPIRPGSAVDQRFLLHFLRQPREIKRVSSLSTGANLPRINAKTLESIQIPLPPIEEQRRIAAVLDAADALRAKRREALAKLETLTQAVFVDMFGDPVTNPLGWQEGRTLNDVADVRSGLTIGRKVGDAPLRTIPYLAVVNVQDGFIAMEPLKTIDATEAEIERFRLASGDILLTEGGDPDKLGRGAIWTAPVEPCIHQNHVFRVRVTSSAMTPEYLSRLLGSARGRRYFLRMAKQTTGIASINATQLRAFPLLEPPIDLQNEFIHRTSRIEALADSITRSMADLDNLFASLQQRAFRGEL